MASDDQADPTRSGSRWEPDGTQSGDDEPTEPIAARGSSPESNAETSRETTAEQQAADAAVPAATGPESYPPPATSSRGRRKIGIPVASAVAAGLVIVSGLGGYALGAATTGDDFTQVSDGSGRGPFPGFPGDFDDDAPDFDDDGPDFDDDGPDFDDDGSDADDTGAET